MFAQARCKIVVGVGRAARKCAERGLRDAFGCTHTHAFSEGGREEGAPTGKKTRACASERREHWIMLKKTKGFQPLYRASWVAGFSPFPLCLSSPLLWYASTDGPPSPEVTIPPGIPFVNSVTPSVLATKRALANWSLEDSRESTICCVGVLPPAETNRVGNVAFLHMRLVVHDARRQRRIRRRMPRARQPG